MRLARPLSAEKKKAILEAATQVVGELGTSAPTAKIAKLAGVAEGTLFTYFATKELLLNAVYLELKSELGARMAQRYPGDKSAKDRALHLWKRYVEWGVSEQTRYRALQQLAVAECVTEESRELGRLHMEQLCEVLLTGANSHSDLTQDFAATLLTALANATVEQMKRDPQKARQHARAGFDAYWRAIGGA